MELVLFFSRGTSLRIWNDTGFLKREIDYYGKMFSGIDKIKFITYGSDEDLPFIKDIYPIELLNNKWKLPIDFFSLLIPFLYYSELKDVNAFKTNQINGWWAAGISKLIHRKPLIIRCGYLLSMNQEQKWKHYSKIRLKLISILEKWAFKYADTIIVTTPQMKKEAIRRHKISAQKINIIPNSVDTNIFKPLPIGKIKGRLGFIGKFTPQKNIHLLVDAITGMDDISLILVGDGPLNKDIQVKAKSQGLSATFLGNIPNHELPELLNTCEAFILPSEWEGMPKALIEAMACGLPVIGTNVHGIRDIITHGSTGYICRPEISEIRKAIAAVMKDEKLRRILGENARKFVAENYSMEESIRKEKDMLRRLIADKIGR